MISNSIEGRRGHNPHSWYLSAANDKWRKSVSYTDAIWDRERDIIHVVERDPKKGRLYQTYPARYLFYYPDPKGKYKSIHGDSLSRVTAKTFKEFIKEQKIHSSYKLYESDINPVFRCLEENYLGKDAPKLNVAFFDIEVDFDPERGYASPEDAFMPITAIAVHLQWLWIDLARARLGKCMLPGMM